MRMAMVSGAIANKWGNGGAVWTRLSWALGLKKLGFRVCFVEQIGRAHCVDAAGAVTAFERSRNLAFFQQVVRQYGLSESAALVYDNGEQVWGLGWPQLLDWAEAADLLVNITGHLALDSLTSRLRRKVYVDLDPGYTQFWEASATAGARQSG